MVKASGDAREPDDLDRLIKEITVDSYGDDEQLEAFRQAFEDAVSFPCDGFVIGQPVSILEIDPHLLHLRSRGGSPASTPAIPSTSVCPTSRTPSCRCRPSTAARMGPPDQEALRLGSRAAAGCAADSESPVSCPRGHKPMKVIAMITDSAQVLEYLQTPHQRPHPPSMDPAS